MLKWHDIHTKFNQNRLAVLELKYADRQIGPVCTSCEVRSQIMSMTAERPF